MKNRQRSSSLVKQFFIFNRSERKGIVVLLILLGIVLVAPYVYLWVFPPQVPEVKITSLSFAQDSTHLFSFANANSDTAIAHGETSRFPQRFVFNPNTIDSSQYIALGFNPRSVKSILNFRKKGGRFKQPHDLYKVFFTDSNFITQLLPYVHIPVDSSLVFTSKSTYTKPVKTKVVVEINTADSVTLVGLYGIGPSTASRIIRYRSRSGGFLHLNQLTEVWGITPEWIEEMKDKITVDPQLVIRININQVTLDELKQHPYLRFFQANAIINYRKQHGSYQQLNDLKKVILLPDSTLQKLAPYLVF